MACDLRMIQCDVMTGDRGELGTKLLWSNLIRYLFDTAQTVTFKGCLFFCLAEYYSMTV